MQWEDSSKGLDLERGRDGRYRIDSPLLIVWHLCQVNRKSR